MDDSTITFVVLGAVVALFVWDRLPVAIVAIGVALSLWATGVLSLEDALGGFGDPTVIFIASLFVVSEALDASGVTSWVGQALVARVGESRTKLIVYTMGLVALLTALINVNGAVAALVPVAVVMAVRTRRSPSHPSLTVAAPAAPGLRRARRLAAGADRDTGQRDRLRGGGERRRRQLRVSRVRARRPTADRGRDRHRRALRRAAAPRAPPALDRPGLQR